MNRRRFLQILGVLSLTPIIPIKAFEPPMKAAPIDMQITGIKALVPIAPLLDGGFLVPLEFAIDLQGILQQKGAIYMRNKIDMGIIELQP